MIEIRRSQDRGRTRLSWLDSRHSFSFGGYRDPRHMGFGALRVVNDDVVAPGQGFGAHPHYDMEILTFVLPAVMRWTSPGRITEPEPRLSRWASAPDSTKVRISMS